jgi:hypothetical protein
MLNRVNAPIGEVPNELDRIESRADDIFRAVPDWTRVSVYVSRISNTWRSYRPQAVRDGAPSAFINAVGPLITRLRTASAAHDVTATLTAAGDLRAAAIDLTDYYNPMIPADVKRLDLLERELKLSARRGDWVEAAILQAKAADVVWGRLRPVVLLRAGGVVLADEIDAFFAAQAAAVAAQNANDAIDAAWGVIEVVDDVEEIF